MFPTYQNFKGPRRKQRSMNRMADLFKGGAQDDDGYDSYSSYDQLYSDRPQLSKIMSTLGPLAGMLIGQPGLFGPLPQQYSQLYSYFGRSPPRTTVAPLSTSRPQAPRPANAMANPFLRY